MFKVFALFAASLAVLSAGATPVEQRDIIGDITGGAGSLLGEATSAINANPTAASIFNGVTSAIGQGASDAGSVASAGLGAAASEASQIQHSGNAALSTMAALNLPGMIQMVTVVVGATAGAYLVM